MIARLLMAALLALPFLPAQAEILAAQPLGNGYILCARADHSVILTTMNAVTLRENGTLAIQDSKPSSAPAYPYLRATYLDKAGATIEVFTPCIGYKTDRECFLAHVQMRAWMEAQYPPK